MPVGAIVVLILVGIEILIAISIAVKFAIEEALDDLQPVSIRLVNFLWLLQMLYLIIWLLVSPWQKELPTKKDAILNNSNV